MKAGESDIQIPETETMPDRTAQSAEWRREVWSSCCDALCKEATARMKDGGKQGRQSFYFDRNRRNELRNAAKQAGHKAQENSKDASTVE